MKKIKKYHLWIPVYGLFVWRKAVTQNLIDFGGNEDILHTLYHATVLGVTIMILFF